MRVRFFLGAGAVRADISDCCSASVSLSAIPLCDEESEAEERFSTVIFPELLLRGRLVVCSVS